MRIASSRRIITALNRRGSEYRFESSLPFYLFLSFDEGIYV